MSAKNFFANHRFRVRVEKPSEANGWTAKVEERVARVDVEIDLDGIIAILGHKAIHNKSKRATEAGGLIVVKVSKESKL